MAETTADVKRDIELTRARMSDTLQELEQKMNITQIVKNNPWPALALAVGAGVVLSGSRADIKATAATLAATRGASGRVGTVLDELVSQVVQAFHGAIEHRIESVAQDVRKAIVAPLTGSMGNSNSGARNYATAQGDGLNAGTQRAD
ncbi:MAG: DUF3618 domain-containing protein [Gemmatimonadota bacterium]|nr:DUF3618 domain-containing protein [Gemmatimonadota bacterium]